MLLMIRQAKYFGINQLATIDLHLKLFQNNLMEQSTFTRDDRNYCIENYFLSFLILLYMVAFDLPCFVDQLAYGRVSLDQSGYQMISQLALILK